MGIIAEIKYQFWRIYKCLEKGHKGDQRPGQPAIWEQAERTGFAQTWEKKA